MTEACARDGFGPNRTCATDEGPGGSDPPGPSLLTVEEGQRIRATNRGGGDPVALRAIGTERAVIVADHAGLRWALGDYRRSPEL